MLVTFIYNIYFCYNYNYLFFGETTIFYAFSNLLRNQSVLETNIVRKLTSMLACAGSYIW